MTNISSQISGVLVVNKPLRMSSMAAVAEVRRRAGGVKTGHAGTLDPLATGVLVMALGRATKAIDRLMATPKSYQTTIDLTAFTTTDDLEGKRTEIVVGNIPSLEQARLALEQFAGSIQQRPPTFSAIKVDGRRAYKMARAGSTVDLPLRSVDVRSLELMRYHWPLLELRIECGKGFYVRSLARDIGCALGTGGHCTLICRTAVGPFTLAASRELDDLPARLSQDDLLPIDHALQMLSNTR